MLAASDGSLEQSQTKEFWDLFASFQKGVRCIRHTPALGKWGVAARVYSAFEWDPIFGEGTQNLADGTLRWKGDPYPADGTRRVGGAPCP
jgi:hypothetical protein